MDTRSVWYYGHSALYALALSKPSGRVAIFLVAPPTKYIRGCCRVSWLPPDSEFSITLITATTFFRNAISALRHGIVEVPCEHFLNLSRVTSVVVHRVYFSCQASMNGWSDDASARRLIEDPTSTWILNLLNNTFSGSCAWLLLQTLTALTIIRDPLRVHRVFTPWPWINLAEEQQFAYDKGVPVTNRPDMENFKSRATSRQLRREWRAFLPC